MILPLVAYADHSPEAIGIILLHHLAGHPLGPVAISSLGDEHTMHVVGVVGG
jgi:hypothetical protein